MSLVGQELSTLPEHMSSHPEFSGVRVTWYLFLCEMFCRSLFVLFLLAVVLSVLRFTNYDYPSNSSFTMPVQQAITEVIFLKCKQIFKKQKNKQTNNYIAATGWMLEKTKETIIKRESRNTGNIGHKTQNDTTTTKYNAQTTKMWPNEQHQIPKKNPCARTV